MYIFAIFLFALIFSFHNIARCKSLPTDFPIANVQCQYDSPSDTEADKPGLVVRPPDDHTYDTRDEPPAFIIRHVNNVSVVCV